MYRITATNQFKKDYKRAKKRGYDIKELEIVVDKLAGGEKLEDKYRDHFLVSNYEGFRECHIRPDRL